MSSMVRVLLCSLGSVEVWVSPGLAMAGPCLIHQEHPFVKAGIALPGLHVETNKDLELLHAAIGEGRAAFVEAMGLLESRRAG